MSATAEIVWRDSNTELLRCILLFTVTYGTRPTSFLATRTLLQLIDDEGKMLPLTSKALQISAYVSLEMN